MDSTISPRRTIVIPVPLGHLNQGNNTFQGTNSGQSGPYGFGWGQFGWYSIIIRVYYGRSKPHSTGSITSPSAGATFGENPQVTASVNGGTDRVDFLAYYDGYDTDGDGVFQEYHHDYAPTGGINPDNQEPRRHSERRFIVGDMEHSICAGSGWYQDPGTYPQWERCLVRLPRSHGADAAKIRELREAVQTVGYA